MKLEPTVTNLDPFKLNVQTKENEEALKPVLNRRVEDLTRNFPSRFRLNESNNNQITYPEAGRRLTLADKGQSIIRTYPAFLFNSGNGYFDWSYIHNIGYPCRSNMKLLDIQDSRLIVEDPKLRQILSYEWNDANWTTVKEIDQYVKNHFLQLSKDSPRVNGANQAPLDREEKSKDKPELKTAEPTVTEEEGWHRVEIENDITSCPLEIPEQETSCVIQ